MEIATLSLKRVQRIVGNVENWESKPSSATVTSKKAKNVAILYNSVISTIIEGSTDWIYKNGYHNILATIGIGADGTIRNLIGKSAEDLIKDKIVEWLELNSGLDYNYNSKSKYWSIGNDLSMSFRSEPDISFFRTNGTNGSIDVIATIEIKGGADPAGALERLGAVKKSFDNTPSNSKIFL